MAQRNIFATLGTKGGNGGIIYYPSQSQPRPLVPFYRGYLIYLLGNGDIAAQ
jgi:hypothetical protein